MNWLLVGAGWAAVYCLLVVYFTVIKSPPYGFKFSGPMLTWRSRKGLATIKRLASPRRFWRAWGLAGLAVALVGVVVSTLVVAGSTVVIMLTDSSRMIENPANMLVIPGVNDFLPLAAAPEIVLGLLIGMVIHEGGHAIMCYVADIDIKSTGLFFFLGVPLGAFVEPDEVSQERSSRMERLQMFAGGIMNNVVFTIVALALLFGPITGAIATAPGAPIAGVLEDTPAADAGIDRGDRITMVDGTAVEDADGFEAALAESDARTIDLQVNGERETTVTREVVVTQVASGAEGVFEPGKAITAVNGNDVWTEEQFYSELRTADSAEVTVSSGDTVAIEAGVDVVVQENTWRQDGGALSETGVPTGEQVTITHVDGTPVYTGEGLVEQLNTAAATPEQTLSMVVDGETRTYTVSVTPDEQYGVKVGTGSAGIEVTEFGAQYYPSELYLTVLNGGGEMMSLWQGVIMLLFLPLTSLDPSMVTDFPGFIPEIQNFYTVTGVAEEFAVGWFFLASVLYWGAWINLNLAIFNCLPTYALDGGHLFRDTVDEVCARLPGFEPGGHVAETVKGGVLTGTLVILGWLVLSLFV